MNSQQLSFHVIECATDVSSSHARFVVSGHGVPHKSLTLFYEELQKIWAAPAAQAILDPLLSFFSFMEEPEQNDWTRTSSRELDSPCLSALNKNQLPPRTYWAGRPSEIRAAIRAYLLARWGCITRPHDQYEEILLSPVVRETSEIQRFLAALRQFYRFAIERQDYWYDGNPAAAFRIPLRSRFRQAIAGISFSLHSRPALHEVRADVGVKEEPVQRINPASPLQEQPLPVLLAEA
jgi:hypothetical protein